jgi:uncharacterized protein (UPF0303 family)
MVSAGLSAAERLGILLDQEEAIRFESFDLGDAWRVGSRLVELGLARGLPIAVSIMFGEQRVFHAGLPGSSADNDGWLERKFRVVRRFGNSSLAVGARFQANNGDFRTDSNLDPGTPSAYGGAFPLRVRGSLIGMVGVSGLPHLEDHALVVEVLKFHLGHSPAPRCAGES